MYKKGILSPFFRYFLLVAFSVHFSFLAPVSLKPVFAFSKDFGEGSRGEKMFGNLVALVQGCVV